MARRQKVLRRKDNIALLFLAFRTVLPEQQILDKESFGKPTNVFFPFTRTLYFYILETLTIFSRGLHRTHNSYLNMLNEKKYYFIVSPANHLYRYFFYQTI